MPADIYQMIFNLSPIAIVIIQDGSLQLANEAFTKLSGYPLTDLAQISLQDLFTPTEYQRIIVNGLDHSTSQINLLTYQFHILKHDSMLINVEGIFTSFKWKERQSVLLQLLDIPMANLNIAGIKEDQNARIIEAWQTTETIAKEVSLAITERKQAEAQVKHISQHDALTGLYNRPYFEAVMYNSQQSKDLLGIIILDVDGLKLINDTLGHNQGDQLLIAVANLMKDTFRKTDVLARIGGDEFAILMVDIGEIEIKSLIQQLNSATYNYNQTHTQVPLNISCGYSLGVGCQDFPSSLFKEADNNMRKEKLFHSQSSRSAIVQTLKKALEARDFITEGHADRLQELVLRLTNSIGLPESHKTDLRLFAQFHDIGKVGIPDRILFKSGPLTKEELLEMRRHPEIGYQIAQSAPDLAPIAEWILKHHEWWNGNGYPLGIKGEKIPLACRLLAIVDAFDAMTNDRPYRKSLSFSEALTELKKFAGTQFDPELVKNFLEVIGSEANG